MIGIEAIQSKLNLIYGKSLVIGEKSCLYLDTDGEYKLCGIVDNKYNLIGSYNDFIIINKHINGFRKRGKLYGLCDNMGKIIKRPIFTNIGASKDDLVIVSDFSNGLGILNTSTNEYVLDCKYDEIALYDRLDYIIASMDYFDITEITDLQGKKLIASNFNKIFITDKLIICGMGDIGSERLYNVYDLKLKKISNLHDKVILNTDDGGNINIVIYSDGNVIKYNNLKIIEPIKKKEGLRL